MVLIDVQAAMRIALEGDAGTDHLGQAEDVIGFQAQRALDFLTHILSPGLCAEEAAFQADILRSKAHFGKRFRDIQCIRRCAADRRAAKVAQNLNLTLRIAGRDRNNGCADGFRAGVRAETAGEQAVTIGNMDNILSGCAAGRHGAGHHFAPEFQVVSGIAKHLLLACRAGGRLDTNDVAHRHSKETVGIVLSQLIFIGERQFGNIVDGLDIARQDAGSIKFFLVGRDIFVNTFDAICQFCALQRTHFLAGHGLAFFIPIHILYSSNLNL